MPGPRLLYLSNSTTVLLLALAGFYYTGDDSFCIDQLEWGLIVVQPLKDQIVLSFTIKTAIDCAFAQRPVFYCCSNNSQQTITVGAG